MSAPGHEADLAFMRAALDEARAALLHGDVPVGAVLACDGEVVAAGHNRREVDRDPLAHAEMVALRAGARALGRWRLHGCTLYVTVEPCPMCAGALVNARVDRLVYGAPDPRAGACGSIYDIVRDLRLNHRLEVTSGLCSAEAAQLLRDFFRERRQGRNRSAG